MQKTTFLDLFCGCGGFSLGMERAGFQCLAGIDFNLEAVNVFRANFPHVPCVLQEDLNQFTPKELEALIGQKEVDVIVGGPPCQGFSQARQVDGSNHGPRIIADPRRQLYQRFLAFIEHFKPKVFVMENVLGIRTAAKGEYFTRVQAEARALGYQVVPRIEDASNLGVPQMRRRQLFIGVRLDVHGYLPQDIPAAPRAVLGATLGDAIMDLPKIASADGAQELDYDLKRRQQHIRGNNFHYIHRVLEVSRARKLTGHESRPHSQRDLRDFAKLAEGDNSREAMRRGVQFEFPYNKSTFKDRYTRQSRSRPCSTIVAHLSKDGLMFIHPTQNRSITPREAARVQTFPDWFKLPVLRTHQFRIIGNAVPPLVSEAIGLAIARLLNSSAGITIGRKGKVIPFSRAKTTQSIPSSQEEALSWLAEIASKTRQELREIDAMLFLQAWHSLLYLYPDLHPDNAIDHGESKEINTSYKHDVLDLSERYIRSGWPVLLEHIGHEAWRRYKAGIISEGNFYCIDAQRAGFAIHSPSFTAA